MTTNKIEPSFEMQIQDLESQIERLNDRINKFNGKIDELTNSWTEQFSKIGISIKSEVLIKEVKQRLTHLEKTLERKWHKEQSKKRRKKEKKEKKKIKTDKSPLGEHVDLNDFLDLVARFLVGEILELTSSDPETCKLREFLEKQEPLPNPFSNHPFSESELIDVAGDIFWSPDNDCVVLASRELVEHYRKEVSRNKRFQLNNVTIP